VLAHPAYSVTAHPPAYSESAHRVTTTTSEITATNIRRRTVFVVLFWENTKTAVYSSSNSRSNNSTLSEIM
jgi:hypothetical protein